MIDQICKRAFAASLQRLAAGRLTVTDAEGTAIFGAGPAELRAGLRVTDPAFYRLAAARGVLGAAEAYMEGMWETDDLGALTRLMARNAAVLRRMDGGAARLARPLLRWFARRRRNTRAGSRANIAAHYDLGNDFFAEFLDPSMTYSSAVFDPPGADLGAAQRAKCERLCAKLELRRGDRVLEIGGGWGGFAIHAARHHGCRVTTTTISRQQFELARERIQQAGVADRVEVLMADYRDLRDTYDKVVSIEMIEAVGHDFMEDYFRVCCERLRPDGLCAIQAIVHADQVYEESKKTVDFIKRYIFPGGSLPCVWSICDAVKKATDFRMIHLEDIGPHYARTLAVWRDRMRANLDNIRALGYEERFLRMWEFYLGYCEGAFSERAIGAVQILLARPDARRAPVLGALSTAVEDAA